MSMTPDPVLLTRPRLRSIDALRGFDMFWIMGGDQLARTTAKAMGLPDVADQFEHVEWHGFHFYDLIFPLFLFVVGVVLPFSLSQLTEGTDLSGSQGRVYWRIARRTGSLILLGFICNGLLQFEFKEFRWPGVLQRIGICYGLAALVLLWLNVVRQVMLFFALLTGYWLILMLVPSPGYQANDLTVEGCLVGYVDRLLIPGSLYYGYGDNEGLLSTFPALATTLLGVLAGQWLRSAQSPWRKVQGLVLASLFCLVAGYSWSILFPLNKILWTSSFVLVAGGYSLGFLASFYGTIDVMGWRRGSYFFTVIGANAITIYCLQEFVDFPAISRFFLGGIARLTKVACEAMCNTAQATEVHDAVLALGAVAAAWLVLWYMYRKQTFLKV